MSEKYIHTIADENPDLQKQLGCMTGLFQIFNRQHFVTGRRISSHSRKRLPPGESGNSGKEPRNSTQKGTEKNLKESEKERENTSVEPSTSSLSSSSCSSTFSSIDYNKIISQPDPFNLGQSPLSKTPSKIVPNNHPEPGNIRNIVKNSIQKEKFDLSIKTKTKPEGKNRVMKHIDSPRPQQITKPQVIGIKGRNLSLPPKDAPRFSYDERESRDKWKSVAKIKESPRFSLDSRQSSIQKATDTLLEDLQERNDRRLTSVVAKLMGLEAFPDPTDTNKCKPRENIEKISTPSLRKADEILKNNHVSTSPRLAQKDNLSPKLKNIKSPVKASLKFPVESQNSQEECLKPQNLYPSVYGEIEKRLTEIEFKKSGKDLRALKQILEAMQKARENIEENDGRSSYKLKNTASKEITPIIKGINSPKKFEDSFTKAKPAKLVPSPKLQSSSPILIEGVAGLRKLRTRENENTKKELISRKNQFIESSQKSFRPMVKKSSAASYSSKPKTMSPRNPITQASEASSPRKTVNRHHTEIISPRGKLKPKLQISQKFDFDQLSDISSEAKCSARSESNISMVSQNDEVTSNYRSEVATRLNEFGSKFGNKPVTFEQPSPVSVLDTAFYVEESPSPVKRIINAFTDEDNVSSDEAPSNPVDLVNFLNKTGPDLVPEFEGENLENTRQLNNEADADSIESICDSTDPIQIYIAEIILASGLFKDLEPSSKFAQLNPSGHLINPNLFHILEQSKSNIKVEEDEQKNGKINQSKNHEKIQRKLVFDTTDEILVQILISAGYSDPWISPKKLGLRSLTGKNLLGKVFSEMDNLQIDPECGLPREDDTIDTEIPGVVLDIERLIFKDLISEIVSGEAGLPSRLNRHRRQLFNN